MCADDPATPVATKTKFTIRNRFNESVIFECEGESIKNAVEAAVKASVNLYGANLYGANLDGANLDGANLDGANLTRANLDGANLTRANLDGANLDGANLYVANLDGANLYGANLDGANLYGANLYGANLTRANLTPIRDDIWAVLSAAPAEVPALRLALTEGRINGSCYQGECCCLVGTLGKARGGDEDSIPGLEPNSYRAAEMFFVPISPGDTPETSWHVKQALEWVDQWLANIRSAVPALTA